MKIKIIVVDDSPITNRTLKHLIGKSFTNDQVEVEFFTDGKSGVDYLINPDNADKYHLIILDGHIKAKDGQPQIDGPEIARTLEENNVHKRLIIFSSDPEMVKKIQKVRLFEDAPSLNKQLSQSKLSALLTEQFDLIEKDQKNTENEVQTTKDIVIEKNKVKKNKVIENKNTFFKSDNQQSTIREKPSEDKHDTNPVLASENTTNESEDPGLSEKVLNVENTPPVESYVVR